MFEPPTPSVSLSCRPYGTWPDPVNITCSNRCAKPVRPGSLVLRADVIPDVHRDGRRRVIGREDDGQPVRQRVGLERDLDRARTRTGRGRRRALNRRGARDDGERDAQGALSEADHRPSFLQGCRPQYTGTRSARAVSRRRGPPTLTDLRHHLFLLLLEPLRRLAVRDLVGQRLRHGRGHLLDRRFVCVACGDHQESHAAHLVESTGSPTAPAAAGGTDCAGCPPSCRRRS